MLRTIAAAAILCLLPTTLSAQSKVNCKTTAFGKGCGPVLTATVAPNKGHANKHFTHVLTLKTTNAPKLSLGLVIIGDSIVKEGWKLPFMKCNVLINVLGHAVVRSNKASTSSTALRFKAVDGLKIHFQEMWFIFNPGKKGGVSAVNSNGMTLTCAKAK